MEPESSSSPSSGSSSASGSALDLSRRLLTLLPLDDVNKCKDATTLILSFNRISSIPGGISLKSLTRLDIRCNSLTSISGAIFEKDLPKLRHLDLSFNKLKTIPAEIGLLEDLEELLLSRNTIDSLPEELGNCKSLRHLDLFSNKLSAFPAPKNLIHLERLDLGDNSLTTLPAELSCCEKLTRLHCYGNKLLELPQEWKKLSSLIDVSFRWNKLSKLPDFLLSASKLEILDISGNPMTDLGVSGVDLAAAWPRLQKLNLYACKITQLPEELLSKSAFSHLKSILIGKTPLLDTIAPEKLPQHSLDPLAGSPTVAANQTGKTDHEILLDRIKGCIYGNAIGDALGLASEFTRAEMARHFYGYKPRGIGYEDILRDDHRFNWIPGDWTDDTDQMLLILDSIFEKNGSLLRARREKKQASMNVKSFASSLKSWVKDGFDIFGDTKGCGCGATVRSVVQDPEFVTDPVKAATTAWLKANKNAASNGAIMRTALLGIIDFSDTSRVISNTKKYCRVTHVDPRAVASCVASTVSISTMLKQGSLFNPLDPASIQKVVDKALGSAMKELDDQEHKSGLLDHFMANNIVDLKLDEPDSIGYTYKSLGCVGFVLRNITDFRRGMELITLEAGDADTNAAIAGAVLGCKLGFSAIPQDLIDGLVHKDWLDEKVNLLLRLMGLIDTLELPDATERSKRRNRYLCGDRFTKLDHFADPTLQVASPTVHFWQGDITTLELDAIVNVADENHFPAPVGALDQRVHFAAGPQFAQECRYVGKVEVAGAVVTPGCMLPASFVIHTVTPTDGDETKLKECYFAAMNAASMAGFGSVAFPLLGSSKLAPAAAAAIAMQAIQLWSQKMQEKGSSVTHVVLVAYNDSQLKALKALNPKSGASTSSSN